MCSRKTSPEQCTKKPLRPNQNPGGHEDTAQISPPSDLRIAVGGAPKQQAELLVQSLQVCTQTKQSKTQEPKQAMLPAPVRAMLGRYRLHQEHA